MTKSSEEIEREVEATRGDLDRTVEALKEKMSPGPLFDEASRVMGGASNQLLTKVVEQARENPMPIALIGFGLAWLALSQKKSHSRRYADDYERRAFTDGGGYQTYEGYQQTGGAGTRLKAKVDHAVDAAKDGIAGAKDKLSGAMASARDGLAHARHDAADGASGAKAKINAVAHSASDRAGRVKVQAEQRFHDTLDSEPLILAAIGVAVGAAVGAALPSTPAENRYVGPTRDKLVGKGKDVAQASLEDAKGIAERAYGQVKEELHRQTGPEGEGSTLKEKAQAIATAGATTVQDELHGRLPN